MFILADLMCLHESDALTMNFKNINHCFFEMLSEECTNIIHRNIIILLLYEECTNTKNEKVIIVGGGQCDIH